MAGGLTQPPPVLAAAIANAANRYKVPPDLLVGIWREESGGTFPNPAVNPSGYGGLFGTPNWNAPTQDQANYAAQVLHNGLTASQGNVAQALSYYNSGRLSGGYTSVPGQTTTGTVPGYSHSDPSNVFIIGGSNPNAGIESAAGKAAQSVPGVSQVEAVGSFVGKLTDPSYLLRGLQIVAGAGLAGAGLVLLVRQVGLAADLPDPVAAMPSAKLAATVE